MTRHETFDANSIANADFVLATDLDGTFLGGSDEARKKFYSWIEGQRARVGLIFVTGRDPGHIRDLTRRRGVPRPDFVVGDVGTTIAAVDDDHFIVPIPELEDEVATAWNDAGTRVQAALRSVRGLTHAIYWLVVPCQLTTWTPATFVTRARLDIVAGLWP